MELSFRSPLWRRRLGIMIFGIILMGLGICLFKLSAMGNDPSSAMVMAIGDLIGLPFSVLIIVTNLLMFLCEIGLKRDIIGIGTFFNWFGVGIFTDAWTSAITNCFEIPTNFTGRLGIMFIGILILSLSCSLYQTANLGIAPYDSLSLIMTDRLSLPYFWCRIITDSICAIIAFFCGGIIGLGTLVCALGLGPFINFFNNTVSKKLCGETS